MNSPRYLVPQSVGETVHILEVEGEGAHVIAGGTDLVVRMRDGVVRPTALVDIQRLPELAEIDRRNHSLHIGATVTIASLITSPDVRRLAPVIAEAGSLMGAVQLRNLATVGGNLASAVPSADLAPPLLALGAVAHIIGPTSRRTLPLEAFFVGPHLSALAPGELLTAVEVPLPAAGSGAAFLKFGKRSAQVLSVVNASAWVQLRNGIVEEVRIALGAVAPTPMRARAAEDVLRGEPPDPRHLDESALAAAAETKPISDMRGSAGFRRELSRVLVRRALERAVQRARQEGFSDAV